MKGKYTYRNLKGVILHGIPPFGTKTFNQPIEGGGIVLINEKIVDKKKIKQEGDNK